MDDAGERHDHRTNHGIKTDRGGTPSQERNTPTTANKANGSAEITTATRILWESPRIDKRNRDRKDKEENGKTRAPEITSNNRLRATSQPNQPTKITGVASNSRNAPGTESRETNYSKRGNIGEYDNWN